jgi:hypothetical protein
VKKGGMSFFDEYFPSLGACHSSLFPQLILFFEFSDLLAERGLGGAQDLGGSREVQLGGQNPHGVQLARVNVGEHCSNPKYTFSETVAFAQTARLWSAEWPSSNNTARPEKLASKSQSGPPLHI